MIFQRLAARPEGPHPQEPLRTRPRRRPEGDHQGRLGTSRRTNDVKAAVLRQRRLEVKLDDEATNTPLLGFVFHMLNENKVARSASAASASRPSRRIWIWWRRKNRAGSPEWCKAKPREGGRMDAPATIPMPRYVPWLPYWAVLQTDLRQTVRGWVWRDVGAHLALGRTRLSALSARSLS